MRDNGFVTHKDQEAGMIGVVSRINQVLNGRGTGAVGHGLHVHIDTFLFLPSQPILESRAVSVCRSGHDKHLHRGVVEVGMIGVDVRDGPAIEQLLIGDFEIRAIGVDQHLLCGTCISTVKMNSNFDVVEHTDSVVDGVIAHRLNGHLADLYTTHHAFHTNNRCGFRTQTTSLVGGFIHDERHLIYMLAFTYWKLTRHQSMHAVVFKTVVRSAVARDFDARIGAERHGDELVDDGKLRITLIAADDGVGQS